MAGNLPFVRKGIDFSKRRKKWLILLAFFGASSYGAYKAYHLPSVTRKRKTVARMLGALASAVEMVAHSAETVAIVSKDVNQFLRSDSDEIPNSLKQICKLSQSNECSKSLSKVFEAVTAGILRGYYHQSETGVTANGSNKGSCLSDRIIDRVLSDAGTGFVSVVVGSFARNLVLGFYSDIEQYEQRPSLNSEGSVSRSKLDGSSTRGGWVDAICHDKSKELIASCVQLLVSTAVAAYLDKTMDVNVYDELFSGLTNPKHEAKVKDMMVTVCNGAVETFVKTTHRALTTKKKMNAAVGSSYDSSFCSVTNEAGECSHSYKEEDVSVEREREAGAMWDFDKMSRSQWMDTVSSTLADPNNRRFVISMTGRVTFGTLRSLVDFFLWKILDGLRMSTDIARAQIVGKGLEVVRYFSARSSVIVTICLALYVHVLCGTVPLLRTC